MSKKCPICQQDMPSGMKLVPSAKNGKEPTEGYRYFISDDVNLTIFVNSKDGTWIKFERKK